MRIRDLLAAESIELNGSAAGKQDVLNKIPGCGLKHLFRHGHFFL